MRNRREKTSSRVFQAASEWLAVIAARFCVLCCATSPQAPLRHRFLRSVLRESANRLACTKPCELAARRPDRLASWTQTPPDNRLQNVSTTRVGLRAPQKRPEYEINSTSPTESNPYRQKSCAITSLEKRVKRVRVPSTQPINLQQPKSFDRSKLPRSIRAFSSPAERNSGSTTPTTSTITVDCLEGASSNPKQVFAPQIVEAGFRTSARPWPPQARVRKRACRTRLGMRPNTFLWRAASLAPIPAHAKINASMHFRSLLEPQLDPTDVAPVLQ